MQIAIIKNGEVQRIITPPGIVLGDEESAVVVPEDAVVSKHDLWDGTKFISNPEAEEIAAVEAKKREIAETLKSVKMLDELKTAVATINDDVNP